MKLYHITPSLAQTAMLDDWYHERFHVVSVIKKHWTPEQIAYQPDEKVVLLGGDTDRLCAAFGRAVAHREAHRRIAKENDDWALVMEDGFTFSDPEFTRTVLGNLDLLPQTNAIAQLGLELNLFAGETPSEPLDTDPPFRWVASRHGWAEGASCYAVNAMTARALVEAQSPIRCLDVETIFSRPAVLEWKMPIFFRTHRPTGVTA